MAREQFQLRHHPRQRRRHRHHHRPQGGQRARSAAIAKDGSGVREEISIRVIVPVAELLDDDAQRHHPRRPDASNCWSTARPATLPTIPPRTLPGKAATRSVATVDESGNVTGVQRGHGHHHRHLPQRPQDDQHRSTSPYRWARSSCPSWTRRRPKSASARRCACRPIAYDADGTHRGRRPGVRAGASATRQRPHHATTATAPPPSPACAAAP